MDLMMMKEIGTKNWKKKIKWKDMCLHCIRLLLSTENELSEHNSMYIWLQNFISVILCILM